MSILINSDTKVIVQGITGTQASFHIKRAANYGTNIVAGVSLNHSDATHLNIPLFSSVLEAKEQTNATASLIFVPAKNAKFAIFEAIEAKLEVVVVITSGIPTIDMMEIKQKLLNTNTILIGPNTPGIITPNEAYMGIYPDILKESGNIGIISRSSTLTYEVMIELNKEKLGQSSVVALGDDNIIGTNFISIYKYFHDDKKTKSVVLICGIGSYYEEEFANYYKDLKNKKTVIAFAIDDQAIFKKENNYVSSTICRGIASCSNKINSLKDAGIIIVNNISDLKTELSKL